MVAAGESWISFVGPLTGGLIAGLLFRLTHPSQCGGGSAIFKAPRESLAPFIIEFVGPRSSRFERCFWLCVAGLQRAPLRRGW